MDQLPTCEHGNPVDALTFVPELAGLLHRTNPAVKGHAVAPLVLLGVFALFQALDAVVAVVPNELEQGEVVPIPNADFFSVDSHRESVRWANDAEAASQSTPEVRR